MSAIWFKCFPSDFLNGMGNLSAEERGVYVSLIFMMYDERGSVVNDSKTLARRCGVSTRRFNVVRNNLLETGKIREKDGRLFNKRVFKQLLPEFISDLSLIYLVLIFPKWRNFKDLAHTKKLEPRIQKKINNKKGVRLVAENGSQVPDFEQAVSSVHGPTAWITWFSNCEFEDGVIYPKSEFKKKRIERDFGKIILDHGYVIGEPRKQEKSA